MTRRSIAAAAAFLLVLLAPREGRAQGLQTDSVREGEPALLKPHPVRAFLEGLAVNVAVNRVDAWVRGVPWAFVTPASWASNFKNGWAWDTDGFSENMFAHPYHGAAYFNAARDNGMTFWEAAPFAFAGSLMWEYLGETERPSLNDIYNTAFGGMVVGEMGHRLATLVRNNQAHGLGRILREVAAMPFDPIGGVNRLLHGDFTRIDRNPVDHRPPAFGFQLAAGGSLGRDSGSSNRSLSGTLLADVAYGNPYVLAFHHPFDVFRMHLEIDPTAVAVKNMTIRGRLFSHELTDTAAALRTLLTVSQKMEYINTPAYKFGGQSVGLGLVSALKRDRFSIQADLYAEALILGAVDAPRAGIGGSLRTYDFGPGGGIDLSVSLLMRGFRVLSVRERWVYVHSVSGAPANHYTQFASAEAILPITHSLGLGAFSGYYYRHSVYDDGSTESSKFPEFRLYLAWHNNYHAAVSETP